jgi:hypothetical protein
MISGNPFGTPEADRPSSVEVESVGVRIKQFVVPPVYEAGA